ncbi:MAG TPA: 50S ribosomal protein L24 [bacterium]|jgi:large subunit ribosomal protein L24
MAEKKKAIPKLNIKKDDTVYVLAGKDRGATGRVLSVDPVKQRAVVEGINMVKRHRKVSQGGGGGITDMPAAIHVSNLMVHCPHCKKHTRPKKSTFTKSQDNKERTFHVRVCRNCGEQLDTL